MPRSVSDGASVLGSLTGLSRSAAGSIDAASSVLSSPGRPGLVAAFLRTPTQLRNACWGTSGVWKGTKRDQRELILSYSQRERDRQLRYDCLCLCLYSRVGASCVGCPICVCAVSAPLPLGALTLQIRCILRERKNEASKNCLRASQHAPHTATHRYTPLKAYVALQK